ncbi:formamidopyrimidine-DNA glycosylase [Kordiimonas sediminis]|uniref:Formamidopyrimidine-DNA glycosylase n=1 Tax=Kordiimonas sediminis TaxID=1735581 RepID=A0A919AKH4_9PROT|nr:bifunctional DNA-formamidopyrimidine glycosylase/DNA-(apurinic or apyrimidinic site) lyase [Kordiimonas sediminis]GHF12821.1 formamidopyrimidine-DNA glycosylase [Kordiimonas sediminis]
MPELPEVETVKEGLVPALEGAVLSRVEIRRPKLRFDIPADFAEKTSGQSVERLERRSKYILIHLSNSLVILLHLGMSGRIRIYGPQEPLSEIGKHDHVSFYTQAGHHILFTDPRRFGVLTYFQAHEMEMHPLLKNIGPEPLSNAFSEQHLAAGLAKRKSPIKTALLDQKLVAGLGNIYVCEALWRSHIHPERKANSLSNTEIARLFPVIKEVLQDAIKAGGSTLKDYATTDGELGYFQHQFNVYGREDAPCSNPKCGGTITRIVQSNRSTFFCPKCQK